MDRENMVRCVRCHTVFDANLGPCPKCGTPYQPRVVAPPPPPDSFVDRYSNTEFIAPVEMNMSAPARRSSRTGLMLGGGVALIAVAMVGVILVTLGAFSPGPTERPQVVVPITASPSAAPTLPPSITDTLAQLNDPSLSAHFTVDSRLALDARVNGAAVVYTAGFDGNISGRDESGIYKHNGVAKEIRYVEGTTYGRILPNGKWAVEQAMPSFLVFAPMFNLTSPNMIQVIGQENRNGITQMHLQSTAWWQPDMNRMAIMDVSGAGLAAEDKVLDLWVTMDGTPVSAHYAATTSATSGAKLLDIEVTYTFRDVGLPVVIGSPEPSPSPTPKS